MAAGAWSSYYSKLEKADILEMTVKYLKNMKRQQLAVAMGPDPNLLGKYIAGYNECTTEISKYLNTVDGLNPETRTRLMNHLANNLQRSSITMAANTAVTSLQLSMNQSCGGTSHSQPLGIQIPAATQLAALPGSSGLCLLNQGAPQIQTLPTSAMQLVPAKLPSGELVFLLANQQTISPTGAVSVVSAIQNNVNNININPSMMTAVGRPLPVCSSAVTLGADVLPQTVGNAAQGQLTFPDNISPSSSLLIPSKDAESPSVSCSTSSASTSGSSPDSDVSDVSTSTSSRSDESRYAPRMETDTPKRPASERQRSGRRRAPDTDSESESDVNESDLANNNDVNIRELSVIRGPMWRPW
ncbi:hypothetical protein LSH36_548g03028 [Paralvinella palmiformis]|uniref:Orange domain-containing protein n=1 Tax=Paralvinella palmiformis TaxID=53620 RepID=A0AAD9MW15_9ANNE|nr:hypothetical protein LSH36_548g03028 [Paralvinella palmiformis]